MRPLKSYIICMTQRSGSSLLRRALRQTGICGDPREYFNRDSASRRFIHQNYRIATYPDYIEKAIERGTTSNGVFGAVMAYAALRELISKVRESTMYKSMPTPEIMSSIFPNLQYIYLTRQDKVRQAVSLAKARQTDIWVWDKDITPVYKKEPIFNFKQIDNLLNYIINCDAVWQKYFEKNSITPFKIVYEDLVDNLVLAILNILRWLNIPIPRNFVLGEIKSKKLTNVLSEEWVDEYYRLSKVQ